MFPSLRIKLIVAFATVTFVTVTMTALGTLLLLRQREIAAERMRVGQLGNAVAEQVTYRIGLNWQADAIANFLQQRADELHVRFLLIELPSDTVIADTGGKLAGQPAAELTGRLSAARRDSVTGFGFATWQGQIIFHPSTGAVFRAGVQRDYRVLLLVPESDITDAWHNLLPRLLSSGAAALIASIGVAYLLARSITHPVRIVTRASEAMARGDYDQRIPVGGKDEIGRLAASFNQMALQVSRTHQTMRDLAGNVAHELKTPLTSIQGYSQALLDGLMTEPEDTARAARVINDESERMRRLVEDLLYLSRLESGQLQVAREPVNTVALLETAAERVRWQLGDGGVGVELRLSSDLPAIRGDERRLEQVLANLLDNAARHTPPGGRITLAAEPSAQGTVTLTVRNSGSYIPPEHHGRIFERFYQVDPSRTRDGSHGGLGLAIVRELVLAHGGRIGVRSSAGAEPWTEFFAVLPAGPAPAGTDRLWQRPPARAGAGT